MLNKIQCSNPVAQFQTYREEILENILKVCETGSYILGTEVQLFEKEFAAYIGTEYCVGVGSGTDALALTLKAYGIGLGDEVITVSHTALATAAAIVMTGATPVLVDIEEDYYTMDPTKIQSAITPKTKAIIPVHLYGQPCDLVPIMSIAKANNLIVIEDCAQAHGAIYKNQKVGSIAHAGCFSFYPTKNLGAIGDGGGITTNDKDVYEKLKRLRQYGWDSCRISRELGVVSRLDEIQATILRIKLRYLDSDNLKRKQNVAEIYEESLAKTDVILPKVRPACEHVYHLYVIRTKNRAHLKSKLSKINVELGIHYEYPVHKHPGYLDKIRISPEGLSVTDSIIEEILTLPVYPELKVKDSILQELK